MGRFFLCPSTPTAAAAAAQLGEVPGDDLSDRDPGRVPSWTQFS
jgi:hypothetical protein